MSKGKPALRGSLLHDEDYTIVAKYGSEYRGFVQYYLLAQDVFRLEKLRWVMETSMLKTRKYSEVLWKGMPMADVAVRGGHIGKGVLVLWC
jgi:hypothetical protein